MKFKSLFAVAAIAALAIVGCDPAEELGEARISVDPASLSLGTGDDSKTVTLVATRDWHIDSQPDWVALDKTSGTASTKEQTITVSVGANKGNDREGEVVFTIGLTKASLAVKQAGEKGEYVVETLTCAEFIKTDGVTEYIISGNITSVSTDYKYAYINDGTAEVEVYQPTNWSEYADKIKVGAKLTAQGVYTKYTNASGKTYDELVGVILDVQEAETPEPTEMTLTEIVAAADATPFIIKGDALVTAVTAAGFVVTDGTAIAYAYAGSATDVKIGDKLAFSGTKATYNGIPELKDIDDIKVLSSDNSVSYPEARDITSIFDTYTNSTMEYISFIGILAKSGNYYNVTVDGATKMTGSIQTPAASLKAEDFDSKMVKVTGYYIGISSSKYQNILAVAIEEDTDYKYFGVEKTEISVGATSTSATINVTGNVAWTAASSDATIDPASGEGKGAITVSFAANTDTENAKTYTVVVSTTEDVATKSYTVTITQSKASAGGEVTVLVDLTAQGYSNQQEVSSITVDGVTVAFDKGSNSNAPKFYTTGNAVRVYGGGFLTVSADGKNVTKVEFTFGSGDGTNELSADSGALNNGVWEGDASSVKFTVDGTSGHRRFAKLVVTAK